jgi:hypothetical protein
MTGETDSPFCVPPMDRAEGTSQLQLGGSGCQRYSDQGYGTFMTGSRASRPRMALRNAAGSVHGPGMFVLCDLVFLMSVYVYR